MTGQGSGASTTGQIAIAVTAAFGEGHEPKLECEPGRGLVADCTDLSALTKRLAEGPITLYCGFDPTGDSLHVGHLMGQLTLRRFQLAGHHPIAVAGGATGMIGDPSGKSQERVLQSAEQIEANLVGIRAQLERFLRFDGQYLSG